MAVSTRRKPMTNVDANLEAASAPIALEPEAGGIEGRHIARMAELVRQGVPRQQAMEIAGREVIQAQSAAADARADARVQSGYRDPRQTAYNAETFAEGYGFDESGNPAHLGKVDIDNLSEGELVDRGRRAYNARDPRGAEAAAAGGQIYGDYVPSDGVPQPLGMTAPGPRTLDGRPTAMPKPLMTPEDVEAYDVRPNRGLSQRDRDMAKRGMVPVVTADGVSYMLAYQPTEAPTDEDIVSGGRGAVVAGRDGKLFRPLNDGYQIPGGPGRAGPRPDLEDNYEAKEMVGPDGNPVMVLRPTKEFADGQKAVMKTRRAALDADFQKRRAHRIALAQLAGGSQNINSGNRWMAEALLAMTPDQRSSSMRYMLPGGDRAAAVDARNMENAGNIIGRFMTSGAAAGMMNPGAAQQQAEANALKMRQADPMAAGRGDIATGNWQSPEATAEAERLAEQHDTGGWNSMSWEDEAALAATLQKPPYNLPQPEAEAAANRAANKRRWAWSRGKRPGPGVDPSLGTDTGPGGLPAPPGSTPYRTGA